MMIHQMSEPIRGNTHARIGKVEDNPGSAIIVIFQLGTVDDAGVWAPDPIIPPVTRRVAPADRSAFLEETAAAGAPVTAGEHEYRKSDLFAWLDAYGWLPAARGR